MLKKIISKKSFSVWFLIITELILAYLLDTDHALTTIGISVVMVFWAILSHIFIKWLKFEDEFNELKQSKSQTEKLLNEFAESNRLMQRIANSAKSDLEFDKYIKLRNEHKPFQLLISDLKYEYFLTSYFRYNQDINCPAVTNIPRHYFEDFIKSNGEKQSIWMWLIERSSSYQSIQVLNNETKNIYIDNISRLENETNYLHTQFDTKKAKLKSFKKLFVIKNDWMSTEGTVITDKEIIEYLDVWKNKLSEFTKNKRKKFIIKYIQLSKAKGALDNCDYVEDIGVFDNILGIQKPVDTKNALINDGTDISFYFEKEKVDNYKAKFETIFSKAHSLVT